MAEFVGNFDVMSKIRRPFVTHKNVALNFVPRELFLLFLPFFLPWGPMTTCRIYIRDHLHFYATGLVFHVGLSARIAAAREKTIRRKSLRLPQRKVALFISKCSVKSSDFPEQISFRLWTCRMFLWIYALSSTYRKSYLLDLGLK